MIKCPNCKSKMVGRYGKYGWFWGCSDYPNCKGTRDIRDESICPQCHHKLKFEEEYKALYTVTAICKFCGLNQIVKQMNLNIQSHSHEHNPHGWSDEDWHEYADAMGMDESVCWGGD